ncbi:hypothetical protein I6I27_10435 (plasmid) [Staphylococcus pasteuri]|nr:hypothetical protein [Staphylococcus pasteuri]MBL3399559.1 hypothetical protein [Staphylococcus pasteuri]
MSEFNIKSVDAFKSKYSNMPDNKVVRNMNGDELESYFLMIYNLRKTISNGQTQYNKLLKNNNNKKNEELNKIANDYNNNIKSLKSYTPEASSVHSKAQERKTNIMLPISYILMGLSILFTIFIFVKVVPISIILAVFVSMIVFVISIGFSIFVASVIEALAFDGPRDKKLAKARTLDQNYFDREKEKLDLKLERDKSKILSEHKRIDTAIRNDYQSIYSTFKVEAQKLESYLPTDFRGLDKVSTLYGILTAGFGDTWKEIINVYRDQKNMNDLKGHMKDIQNTLNDMNNNIVSNQKETIKTINNQSQQQQRLLKEVNVGVQESNNNIQQLNNDINNAYNNIHNTQKDIYDELADMNPKNAYNK